MSLTTPMKIILALVIVALCGAGFYLLDWQSKYARLDQETKNLADAQAQLAKAEDDLKQLPELTKQMEAKEKELQELVASKFTKEDPQLFVANYIAEIERMVVGQQQSTGDYDFQINSITPGAEQRQNAPAGGENKEGGSAPPDNSGSASTPEALQGFPTRVFQMQMTGRYSTLVDFLYQLGALKLDRLVTINKISLSPGKTTPGDSPILSIQIPLTAYLRQGG